MKHFIEKNSCKMKYIFWIFIAMMTFFRIALFLSIPLDALGNTPHDDQLLVTIGDSLSKGYWLGEYNNRTLVKGISFPAFLAICKWLCIPYNLGLALFYIISVLIFIWAISPILKSPYVKGIIYLFLLYSPAMLSKSTQQRAYNMSLIPSGILLVTGCFIALFVRRERNWKHTLLWSVMAGISFAFFWYIREDSIWLLPFVIGAVVITIVCRLRVKNESWKKKLMFCIMMVLPFLMHQGFTKTISAMNQKVYNTPIINERTNSASSDVIAELIRMEAPQVREDVWVSRVTVERAMACSPTLESIRESIDKIYNSGWAIGGEISGDIIVWAMRDAVADAGYFTDGKTSEEFFQKVYDELRQAYKDGAYTRRKGIYFSSICNPFVFSEDFMPTMERALKNWKRQLFIEGTEIDIFIGTGTTQQIRYIEAVTGSPAVYPDSEEIQNDPVGIASQRAVVYGQRLLKLYHLLTYLLVPISIIGYIWLTISMIGNLRKKQYSDWYLWLIITGLIGCGAILNIEVSWFTTYLGSAESQMYHYTTGMLTIIQLVQILTFLWMIHGKRFRDSL